MGYSKATYDPEKNLYQVTSSNGDFNTRGPLNVGLQVTRKCNLRCIYCSEPPNLSDLEFSQLERVLRNIKDAEVLKVNLTGGEALLRADLIDIVDASRSLGLYVAIDSNATLVTDKLAESLRGKLVYFESTIDGTPETHNRVRGRYSAVVEGIKKISNMGIPVCLAMVLLGKSMKDARHVLKIGHELGARYVKYLTPIPKARGKSLPSEYLDNPYLNEIWKDLCEFREREGLNPNISLANWRLMGQGPVILINSDGEMVGSPSINEENCVTHIGNVLEESVESIWERYPYKMNHIRKYTGQTMLISCEA